MDQAELRPVPPSHPDAPVVNRPVHLLRGEMPGWVHLNGFDGIIRDDKGSVVSTGNAALRITPAPGVPALAFDSIQFPATQVPSTDPNALDDYEEGDWTPNVGGSATYFLQQGKYIKIGRQVTLWCRMQINILGTGSNSGIFGIPFQADMAAAGVVSEFTTTASNIDYVAIHLGPTLAYCQTWGHAAAGTASNPIAFFTNATVITFTITYRTAN